MADNRVPIISFASTKGGVGKTTLAFVLATAVARRLSHTTEYRVACIDADPNGTLDTALRKIGYPDILSLPSDAETLLPTLRDAQRSSALVLIDLEGSAMPIRLSPTATTCGVLPISRVEFCVSRCGDVARNAE